MPHFVHPWQRTYRAVWWANLVTSVGMMSFLPFFPTHLERLGVSGRDEIALWAGVLFGAAPLSAALMGPVWGALGDRIGQRPMLLRSLLAIAVFVGAMALARSPWELLALRLLQGVFSGFSAPSVALVCAAAPPERQGRVAASLHTAMAAGAILGPAVGGALGAALGLRWVFVCIAASSLVSCALVLSWARDEPREPRAEAGGLLPLLGGIGADLKELWGSRALRAVLLVAFCLQFGVGSSSPLLELYVRDLTGADVEAQRLLTGLLFSASAVANLLCMQLWGRYGDRSGHVRALELCAFASAATLALHAAAPLFALLLVVRVLFGAASAGGSPCAFALAASAVPPGRRGGAIGLVFAARTLSIAVSAALGGWLSRYLGIRGLFLLGALLILLAALSLRRTRRASAA